MPKYTRSFSGARPQEIRSSALSTSLDEAGTLRLMMSAINSAWALRMMLSRNRLVTAI